MEIGDEMPAARKVEALLRYATDHGSLEGRGGPQRLDLSGKSITVTALNKKPSETLSTAERLKKEIETKLK